MRSTGIPQDLNFIDNSSGGGGLSKGFVQEGYQHITQIAANAAACNTLRSKLAYHWLVTAGRDHLYADYPAGHVCQERFYMPLPQHMVRLVINDEIQPDTFERIFRQTDSLLDRSILSVDRPANRTRWGRSISRSRGHGGEQAALSPKMLS